MASQYIRLHMPNGGEDGVIVATRDDGKRVEFRGRPYSKWEIDENSQMYELHAHLKRIDVSNLHCDQVETVTPWHPEWEAISKMFNNALDVKI